MRIGFARSAAVGKSEGKPKIHARNDIDNGVGAFPAKGSIERDAAPRASIEPCQPPIRA